MFPVCPGWMPTCVAFLLKRPLTTLSLDLTGGRGSSVLLNSIFSPAPFAHQLFGLMPFPMKRAAKRVGKGLFASVESSADFCAGSAPQTAIDSSQGRAMGTPTPWRTVRRERAELNGMVGEPSVGMAQAG